MTFISSVLSNQGFTPLPTYINPVNVGRCSGRGLSIQHQREIPVWQGFERRGITQYLAGIGNTTVMEQVIAERAAA